MNFFLRVTSRAFCCGVQIADGKVDVRGTAPYLKRYAGVRYEAFINIAREKGWKVETIRRDDR
jgi:hypothetical protein